MTPEQLDSIRQRAEAANHAGLTGYSCDPLPLLAEVDRLNAELAKVRPTPSEADGFARLCDELWRDFDGSSKDFLTSLETAFNFARAGSNTELAEATRERDEALDAQRITAAVLRQVEPVVEAATAMVNADRDGNYYLQTAAWQTLQAAVHALPSSSDGAGQTDVLAVSEQSVLEKVREVRKIQGYDGNWNYSPYMRGMYNGLELALSILEGEREPVYRDDPEQYICDRPVPDMTGPEFQPVPSAGQTDESERSGIHTWGYAACRHPECLRAKAELTASASAPADEGECACGRPLRNGECRRHGSDLVAAASVSAPAEENTPHRWTSHGHTCCPSAPLAKDTRPAAVARCGGPGLCKVCSVEAAQIHTAPAEEKADPDDCPGCHGTPGMVARHREGCAYLPGGVA